MEGGGSRDVLRLAGPAMASGFVAMGYHWVNQFWVGRLGTAATAALSVATFGVWSLYALSALLSVGLAALVGAGYLAGKVMVRPGTAVATAAPTPAASTLSTPAPTGGPTPAATVGPTPTVTIAPTPTREPSPTVAPKPTPRTYVVRSGDTLFSIAAKFGVTVESIKTLNKIKDANLIQVGQRLKIPPP